MTGELYFFDNENIFEKELCQISCGRGTLEEDKVHLVQPNNPNVFPTRS